MCGLSAFSGDLYSLLRTLGGAVWVRRVHPGVNKWSNRTEELSSLFPRISATLASTLSILCVGLSCNLNPLV